MAATQGIRAGRAFVELGVSDKLTAGLKRAQARLRAFGAGVRQLGGQLLRVSAAVATPLVISTIVFANFEQQMARVRALTGASAEEFRALEDEAKRLGETTVFSARQSAEAMGFFALAGYDVQKILQSMAPTLDLAAAGQLEVGQAADIVAKIMAGMGIEANNLGYAVDVLTKAFTTANTDLVALGEAMKYVGPVAKAAGLGIEEVVAAVQVLSNAGQAGEQAGTSLRAFLLSLTAPSTEAKTTLKELGVVIADAEGNVRPLAEIIGSLESALKGMGSAKRLEVLGTIFGKRQASGAATLLGRGRQEILDLSEALRQAGGTAERIAKTQLNTLTGTLTLLKSAAEGVGIAIGETIGGPLRVAFYGVTKMVSAVGAWVKNNRELVVIISASVVSVAALGAVLITAGLSIQLIAFALLGVLKVLLLVKVAFLAVSAVIAVFSSPIGIAVVAIAALIAAAKALGANISVQFGFIGETVDWLRERFLQLRQWIGKVMSGISDALAAGDVALAARVLWLGLQVAWYKGTGELKRIWTETLHTMVRTMKQSMFDILLIAENVWHALNVGWIESARFATTTFAKFKHNALLFLFQIGDQAYRLGALIQEAFDPNFDRQAFTLELDRQLVDFEKQSEKARDKAIKKLDREYKDQRELETKIHEGSLAAILDEQKRVLDKMDKDVAEKVNKSNAALKDAKQALNKALEEAKKKRDEMEKEAKAPGGEKPIQPALEEIASAINKKISVVGTFSAIGLGRLGMGQNAAERTANATEETVRQTKRTADLVQRAGKTFT